MSATSPSEGDGNDDGTKRGWLLRNNFFFIMSQRVFCELEGSRLRVYLSSNTSGNPTEEFNLRKYRVRVNRDDPLAFYLEYRDPKALGIITPWIVYHFSAVSDVEYVNQWIVALKVSSGEMIDLLKEVQTKDVLVTAQEFDAMERMIAPQVDEARQYTQELLSRPCSGVAGSQDTAVHVLSALARSMGKEAIFFSGDACEQLPDSLSSPHIAFHDDTQKFDLHLENALDLIPEDEKMSEAEVSVNALAHVLKSGRGSSAQLNMIQTLREKLARAHGVDVSDIEIDSFYEGSFAFKYSVDVKARSVDDLKDSEVASVQQVEQGLKAEFSKFRQLGIHPLFYRSYFNVDMFDPAGNKDFTNENGSYTLGSGNVKQEYKQPTGWYGYGLKVLYPQTDKFGRDNTWLDPFQNPHMWHKAYHGTASLKANCHQNKVPRARGPQDRPVCGMGSIATTGMRLADTHAFGPGVYCGKHVDFFTKGGGSSFLGEAKIDTRQGPESWQFLLMVAIRPNGYKELDYHDSKKREVNKFYLVAKKEDVRPYRLLFRKTPGQ